LTKGPREYSDFKALPHVAIANKLKMQGKSEADLVGNFIPYLICVVDEKDAKAGLAAKARHPDELLASRGSIMIDVEWYIMQ
jgi:DNA polymerase elongation subunit (family B)